MAAVEYAVDGRVARLTLNRPERGNGISPALVAELVAAVERADLDPAVHVLLLSGNGKGFCGGYDLVQSAEHRGGDSDLDRPARRWTRPSWRPTTTPQAPGTRWSTTP
jgi:enoyl-CoA hydratase